MVGSHMCVFPRKRKRITIYDTDLDKYKEEIDALKKELSSYKKLADTKADKMNFSIWLGSASGELVCWNLKTFARLLKSDLKQDQLEILPDFSSFIEETAYDYILNHKYEGDNWSVLEGLTYNRAMQLLDNVVVFVNLGYLTIDPVEFRKLAKRYFANDVLVVPEREDYFLLKMLMVLALGEIYSVEAIIRPSAKPMKEVPGLRFFQLVIQHVPPVFQLLSLSKASFADTIQVIELFGLIAIYLRVLDKKQLAVIFTLNALEMGISINLHKDHEGPNEHLSKVWWATYCLNRFYSSRVGQPLLLRTEEITRSYPLINKSSTSIPLSKDDFANPDTMRFYIDLAKIADIITNDLYSLKVPFDNKQYLNSTLRILEKLIDWVDSIPDYLKLEIPGPGSKINENNRLVYTLHLNYLHHIYLTCIPILLNYAKARMLSHSQAKASDTLDLQTLPRNISRIILACINASQVTINIFIATYRDRLLRTFGFTDLDYLFSSSLMFIVCLILNIRPQKQDSFEEYLEVAMNLIYEMRQRGNLVAKGKLSQIVDLVISLKEMLFGLGYTKIFDNLYKYESESLVAHIRSELLDSGDVLALSPEGNLVIEDFQAFEGPDVPFLTGPSIFDVDWIRDSIPSLELDLFAVTDEDLVFMDEMLASTVS